MKAVMGSWAAALVLALTACSSEREHDGHGRQDHERHRHGAHDHEESASPVRDRPRIGESIADFSLKDNAGEDFRLETLRQTDQNKGKVAVLTFWCTTCVSCRHIERDFDRKAREYSQKDVLFLMVASNHTETREQVNDFLRKNQLSFPVLMDPDSKIADYFGATVTTTTAVIDAEGKLRYYGGLGKAENAIRDLMAGREVSVSETRPNG